eukprot:718542-Pleurochrysis_carterae.AAC.1
MKSSQRLFSIDERLGLVTARPDFRSPRSPSRSCLPFLRSRQSPPSLDLAAGRPVGLAHTQSSGY